MMRRSILLLAAAALSGCSATGSGKPEMTVSGYAFAPPAFYEFCRTQPALCSTKGKQKVVTLTPARRAELRAVNEMVNRSVAQREDSGAANADRWQAALTSGDCEDLAIRKKQELLKRGWPASALLLTVARMPVSGIGHTVLTVRSSEGDLVLDSASSGVGNWSKSRYKFFARQAQGKSDEWEQIKS